ncbi:hypothetical protein ACFFGH_22090 [Lysobacter korlensis]|uniref:DUF2530 domain-containing protein n=1 Tax=Lysobacter korlensis TaxID=553636 RepID=A0ABV6RXB9_9GAMM
MSDFDNVPEPTASQARTFGWTSAACAVLSTVWVVAVLVILGVMHSPNLLISLSFAAAIGGTIIAFIGGFVLGRNPK